MSSREDQKVVAFPVPPAAMERLSARNKSTDTLIRFAVGMVGLLCIIAGLWRTVRWAFQETDGSRLP